VERQPKRRGGVGEKAEWKRREQSIASNTEAVFIHWEERPVNKDARTRKDVGIKRRTY